MTLLELLQLMRKHLKLVIALPLLCAALTAAVSWLFLPNTYTASVSMYVLSSSGNSQSGSSSSLQYSDLNASQMLTNDVAQLIKSDRIISQAASDLNMGEDELRGYDISVTSSTTTRLITIDVTGDTPYSASAIANGVANATNKVAKDIMAVQAVNVIDQASVPDKPSGPPRLLYTAVGLLAGLFIAVAVVVIADMVNTRVRKPEEIEELLGVPVIGRIPVIKG